ncbi:MAG: hydrolase [Oscillospiraceae bacterium]|nr:hydrolase [Oscillospiraceae bacterium]
MPTISQARELLAKYNKEPFHIQHAETVSGVMKYFAKAYDSGREDYWAVVGLLHDVDFEIYPEEHCVKGEEILRAEGVDESIIRATMSHGWGLSGAKYEPSSVMEKILFATDELTGLIGAAALMRPSKSTLDMELPSLKKKYKDKKFAAGCSREVIADGAEKLGWTLDELLSRTLDAMREVEKSQERV